MSKPFAYKVLMNALYGPMMAKPYNSLMHSSYLLRHFDWRPNSKTLVLKKTLLYGTLSPEIHVEGEKYTVIFNYSGCDDPAECSIFKYQGIYNPWENPVEYEKYEKIREIRVIVPWKRPLEKKKP